MRRWISLVAWVAAAGCGGAAAPGTTAQSQAPAKVTIPSVEVGAVDTPFPQWDVDVAHFVPAIIGNPQTATLVEALAGHKTAVLVTGRNMANAADRQRLFSMIQAAAPSLKVLTRDDALLFDILQEHGDIPYYRTWDQVGTDVFGRPYVLPKDHPLKTEWLDKKQKLQGADLFIVADAVAVDAAMERRMREQVRGGCTELLAEMDGQVQHQSAALGAAVSAVNDALRTGFAQLVQDNLPAWRDQQQLAVGRRPNDADVARCAKAYTAFLDAVAGCTAERCAMAPAVYPNAGGVAGMPVDAADLVPGTCPAADQPDAVAQVIAAAKDLTLGVLAQVPDALAQHMVAIGQAAALREMVADVCDPANRRYGEEDLQAARDALSKALGALSQPAAQAAFAPTSGRRRIPGRGAVEALAAPGGAAPEVEGAMAAFKEAAARLNRCADSRRRPVHVMVVDVASSQVVYSLIDYEEQFFCGDLPPGTP